MVRGSKVGVLALQGAVQRHAEALEAAGSSPVAVRTPAELAAVDALVLPGGESTTIDKLIRFSGLAEPLVERLAAGMPVLGTCAGMILLAAEVLDGRPDQQGYPAIDISVRRNAYGRQVDSFEYPLVVGALGEPAFPATFIRAPVVERAGAGVEVMATLDGLPVLCRQGAVLVAAFHPELSVDRRLHQLFLAGI